jgi:PAS domain S-box-containing protein
MADSFQRNPKSRDHLLDYVSANTPTRRKLSRPHPLWAFTATTFAGLALVLMFGANSLWTSRALDGLTGQALPLESLLVRGLELDEARTAAAEQVLRSGGREEEVQYREQTGELERLLREIGRLAAGVDGPAAWRMNEASARLRSIESEVFHLVERGPWERAAALLESREYVGQKQVYARTVAGLQERVQSKMDAAAEDAQQRRLLANVYLINGMLILLALWLISLALVRRHVVMQKQAQAELQASHAELQERVAERTVVLGRLNEELRGAEQRAVDTARRMRAVAAAAAGFTAAHTLEVLEQVIHDACRSVVAFDSLTLQLYESGVASAAGEDAFGTECDDAARAGTRTWQIGRGAPRTPAGQTGDPALPWQGTEAAPAPMLPIPILTDEGICGVLTVQKYSTGLFTPQDAEVLEAIAALAAPALRNIRLLHEQQSSEEALRLREAYFRSLIENAQDVVTLVDEGGGILYHSPSFAAFTGTRTGDGWGMNLFELVHAEDGRVLATLYREVLDSPGQPVAAELRFQHCDGSWRVFEVAGRNLLGDPAVSGIILNSRDITERVEATEVLRQREEQLRQALKMEAVGRLAGGVAHDFNNLLTAISGNTQLLLMDVAEDDAMRYELHEVQRAAERAAQLTQQLLAFSRRQILQPKVLDLNTLVTGTGKMLRRLLGEGVELITLLNSTGEYIKADPAQIEMVIMNLAVNSRDAMPGGGQLTIKTDSEQLSYSLVGSHGEVPAGNYVVLTVSDNGCGMDEKTLERIYEPFFTTKAVGTGSGLGLATVYGIVKQSGGHIAVHSEPGVGTTFRIYLPAVEQAPEAEALVPAVEAAPGSETVLLVEDQTAVRTMARKILQRKGYTVLEAENGEAAFRLWWQHREEVQLLLTDLTMPLMGGRELARRITEIRPDLRVLYMSGYTEEAAVQMGEMGGGGTGEGVSFLQKPFSPEDLACRVREMLDADSAISARPTLRLSEAPSEA